MKKTALTLTFAGLACLLQAQTHALPGQASLQQHQQFLQRLQAIHQAPVTRSGPELRSSSQRVIGQNTVNHLGANTDSSKVSYYSEGGSAYDYNTMVYAYNYPYSTTPMFNNYQGIYTQPQVAFKRHDRWTINPNTLVYGFYQRDRATYDSYENLLTDTIIYADSNTYSNMIYKNEFNPDNTISKGEWLTWNDGASDSAFKQYFEYNTSGWLVKDSLYEWASGSWHLVAKTFYTHDVAGNPVLINHWSNQSDATFTLPLIQQLRYTNTYDGSNRLLTVHTDYYDGTALSPYLKDSFDYTGGLGFHTTWRQDQYDAINFTWTPQMKMVKLLNTDDLPDTVNIYSYDLMVDQWVYFSRYVMSYNTDLNPVLLKEYIYDFTAFPAVPDFTTTYYYEDYMIPTSTTEIMTASSAKVYPNPTTGEITIDPGNDQQVTSILVMDLQGKTILRSEIAASSPVKINLHQLEKGLYILSLHGDGKTSCMKLVKE